MLDYIRLDNIEVINIYIFSGRIICLNCGKNYRGLKLRKNNSYVCATYSRESGKCSRYPIQEEFLIYTIRKHLNMKNLEEEKLIEYVKRIERKDKGLKILYNDSTESIINENDEYGIKLKF